MSEQPKNNLQTFYDEIPIKKIVGTATIVGLYKFIQYYKFDVSNDNLQFLLKQDRQIIATLSITAASSTVINTDLNFVALQFLTVPLTAILTDIFINRFFLTPK